MTDTIYYDQNGKPCLRESFCVYCDFLGMKDKMMSDQSEEIFCDFMEKIVPLINNYFIPGPQFLEGTKNYPKAWGVKVFTDNIVLAYADHSQKCGNSHLESEFGIAVGIVSRFQLDIILNGYFMRGGWAVGPLFINENTVFGKPMAESYELEQKAMYPRIILSEDVKKLLLKQMKQYSDVPSHSYFIWVDNSDGHWFVNYLSHIFDPLDNPDWNKLHLHAEKVKKHLEKNKNNAKIFAKYLWLAHYHNSFCHYLSDDFDECDTALIKIDLPQYGFHPLSKDDCAHLSQS